MKRSTVNFMGFGHFSIIFCLIVVGCGGLSSEPRSEEETTVIVQLINEGSHQDLELAFESYSLKKKKVISRPLYIILFEFDAEKISNEELVTLLKQSPLVKEAQLNRKVQLRN